MSKRADQHARKPSGMYGSIAGRADIQCVHYFVVTEAAENVAQRKTGCLHAHGQGPSHAGNPHAGCHLPICALFSHLSFHPHALRAFWRRDALPPKYAVHSREFLTRPEPYGPRPGAQTRTAGMAPPFPERYAPRSALKAQPPAAFNASSICFEMPSKSVGLATRAPLRNIVGVPSTATSSPSFSSASTVAA